MGFVLTGEYGLVGIRGGEKSPREGVFRACISDVGTASFLLRVISAPGVRERDAVAGRLYYRFLMV